MTPPYTLGNSCKCKIPLMHEVYFFNVSHTRKHTEMPPMKFGTHIKKVERTSVMFDYIKLNSKSSTMYIHSTLFSFTNIQISSKKHTPHA